MAVKPFDPTVKTLVETSPGDWPVLLGQPSAPTEVIDADIATVSGAADKVLLVRADVPYLLHLEFQAGHDSADLPRLLHLRSTLLEHRHRRLVRAAAVILKAEADSPALTGEHRLAFPNEGPYDVFRYEVVRVWQLSAEDLLRGGPGTLPLAPISAVTEGAIPGIISRMEARKRPLSSREQEFWSATAVLLGLRYPAEKVLRFLQGVGSMEESTYYQMVLKKGEAEGKATGLAEGKATGLAEGKATGLAEGEARGRREGELAEARRFLLRMGEEQLGPPSAEIAAAVNAVRDVRRLEAMGKRLLRVESWQELLSKPSRRSKPRPRPTA